MPIKHLIKRRANDLVSDSSIRSIKGVRILEESNVFVGKGGVVEGGKAKKDSSSRTARPTLKPTTPPATSPPNPSPTDSPTPSPTPSPTSRPSSKTTIRSTPNPTHRSTPNPTHRSTTKPSPRSTTKPTPKSTPSPIPQPITSPTTLPTKSPTSPAAKPVNKPVNEPVSLPTVIPTTSNDGRNPADGHCDDLINGKYLKTKTDVAIGVYFTYELVSPTEKDANTVVGDVEKIMQADLASTLFGCVDSERIRKMTESVSIQKSTFYGHRDLTSEADIVGVSPLPQDETTTEPCSSFVKLLTLSDDQVCTVINAHFSLYLDNSQGAVDVESKKYSQDRALKIIEESMNNGRGKYIDKALGIDDVFFKGPGHIDNPPPSSNNEVNKESLIANKTLSVGLVTLIAVAAAFVIMMILSVIYRKFNRKEKGQQYNDMDSNKKDTNDFIPFGDTIGANSNASDLNETASFEDLSAIDE